MIECLDEETKPNTLSIEPDKWETPFVFLPGGLPPLGLLARADGRVRHQFLDAYFDLLTIVKGFTRPGRHPLVFVMKFHVECNQNHVWGPLGA